MRHWLPVFAVGAVLGGPAGCSTDSDSEIVGEATACVPGELKTCPCIDGTVSTQICGDDGTSYGSCQCSSSPGSGGAFQGTGGVQSPASGGTVSTGGTAVVSTGGVTSSGTGGFIASGGTLGSGGGLASGGTSGSGGSLASGGTMGSGGTTASGGTISTGGGGTVGSGTLCLQAGSGDYTKQGPYAVTTKSVDLGAFASLPSSPTTYTIFYPTNMEADCPHPIIAWGNGTGVTGSQVYAFYNNNAASWGMVVIASDNSNVGSGAFHRAGIDYLLAQNEDPSSDFYHKLNPRAGTSGHSQGAIGATVATNHSNVEAEVQVQGGGTPKAGIAFLALTGTADTIVGTGPPTQSYDAATGPAFLAVYTGADHVTTPTLGGYVQNNAGTIQYMRLYTAWFRCFLADDATACALFEGGQSCGICSDPNWDTLESKNF